MGRGVKLTDEQFEELDAVRWKTKSADVYRNCLIVLFSNAGDTIAEVAQRIGCGADTVVRTRMRYRQGGVAALQPIKPTGRPPRATPEFLQRMRATVQSDPQLLGYGFSIWSCQRLAEHLAEETGIRFSGCQIQRLLRRERFSVQRPNHTMRGKRDEAAFEKAQAELLAHKKKALRRNAAEVLIFQGEVEIHRHPTLARAWAPVGSQPEIPAPGQNEKKVVYGGVNYATGKTTYTIADTKSGVHFLQFLIVLVTAYAGRKIRLVCDNGRFHHTKAVQPWLAEHRHQIEIYWLPPYCPSLNLIERLWGHLKRTVLANVLYKNINDLEAAFRRGVGRINGHRDKMGFMFNHDDLLTKKAA